MYNKTKTARVKRHVAVISIVASLMGTNIFAQDAKGKAGLSADELAKKADAYFAQWDKNDQPGCAVGVVSNGKLVYKRAFGMANLDYDIPNSPEKTLFNLASASKPFTAMSIALLAQQGKLSLDDEIQKYVPEIPRYEHPITIRHLLSHTSGIRDYLAVAFFSGLSPDRPQNDKSVLTTLARQKNISFRPGDRYQYSNSGYHLLGIIVGRVSGKSLRAFADENIFKPLGMKNTMFFDNRQDIVKNRATGYTVSGNTLRARASLFDLVGGGGVLTTVEDLALWDQNFYEPKVGTRELIAVMTAPATLNSGEKTGYGFGLFHNRYKGLPVYKHSGNMSGHRALFVTFPAQKLTTIALCNNFAMSPTAITDKLADIYLDGQFAPTAAPTPAPPTLPAAMVMSANDAARYVGTYAHGESGRVFKISSKEGKLVSTGLMPGEVPVTTVSETRFILVDGPGMTELNPVLDKSGDVREIHIRTKSGKPDIYQRVASPTVTPEKLAEYAGTYYSDEFDADHVIVFKDNKLSLVVGDNLNAGLVAWYPDYFTVGGQLKLSFTRNDKGAVSGFVFNSDVDEREIKKVVFKRK